MDRKMANFIKEQYPPGTRIRLNSMEDGIPCNRRCQLIRLRVCLTKYPWDTDREYEQNLKAHVQVERRVEHDDAHSRSTLQG